MAENLCPIPPQLVVLETDVSLPREQRSEWEDQLDLENILRRIRVCRVTKHNPRLFLGGSPLKTELERLGGGGGG